MVGRIAFQCGANCAHFVPEEQPKALANELMRFLMASGGEYAPLNLILLEFGGLIEIATIEMATWW